MLAWSVLVCLVKHASAGDALILKASVGAVAEILTAPCRPVHVPAAGKTRAGRPRVPMWAATSYCTNQRREEQAAAYNGSRCAQRTGAPNRSGGLGHSQGRVWGPTLDSKPLTVVLDVLVRISVLLNRAPAIASQALTRKTPACRPSNQQCPAGRVPMTRTTRPVQAGSLNPVGQQNSPRRTAAGLIDKTREPAKRNLGLRATATSVPPAISAGRPRSSWLNMSTLSARRPDRFAVRVSEPVPVTIWASLRPTLLRPCIPQNHV